MLTRYVKPMEHDRGNGRSLLAWRPQSIVKIWRLNTVPNVHFRSKRLLTRLKTIKNNDEDDKKITIRTICGKRILMEANIAERRATIKSTCENWHKQNKINHRAHVSVPFSRVTWSLSRGSVMWHLWQFPPQIFQGRLHDSSFVIYLLNPWLKLNIKENTSVVGHVRECIQGGLWCHIWDSILHRCPGSRNTRVWRNELIQYSVQYSILDWGRDNIFFDIKHVQCRNKNSLLASSDNCELLNW